MDLIRSIIMGIVQGVAEFLPISSSGHLAIMKHILHIDMDTGLLFDVMLHVGTLAAIFMAFWKDISELLAEGFKMLGDFVLSIGRKEHKQVISTPYRRFVLLVVVSTIPTAIMGFILQDAINLVSQTLLVPGLCLVLTGILLRIADRVKTGKKSEADATYKDAGFIGIAQGFATLPGLSRSGTTITACLLAGFDRNFAVKYSFIMSIPAVIGAAILEIKDFTMASVTWPDMMNYLIGTIIAGIVGYVSIKTMLVIVKGKKFKVFSYYCLIIGLIAVVGYFMI